MNFTQMKARVALQLGNMQTNDPFYGELDGWVNDAIRGVVERTVSGSNQNMNLFPELVTRYVTLTVVDTNSLALPATVLVPLRLYSFGDPAAPVESDDNTKLVAYVRPEAFEALSRETTITGYPRIWTRIGNAIYLWPTPRTGYTTYVRLYALKQEPDLALGTDAPVIEASWHRSVTNFACYIGSTAMGWFDRAEAWMTATDAEIARAVDPTGILLAATESRLAVTGAPERWDVYGN